MAKIYGLFGSMTGKVADVVMGVRFGEQIVRRYQPMVSNPNTPGQVEARAKLKLMSQLSAILAPALAIPRDGAKSSRNLFVKKNYGLVTYQNNQAEITLTDVQLTNSVVGLPIIIATRGAQDVEVALGYADNSLDRVVYVGLIKNPDNTLRYATSVVVDKSVGVTFRGNLTLPSLPSVVYAYGIRDNSEAAIAKFGDLNADSAETIAKLIVTRALTEADITLTETQGVEVPATA